MSEPLAEGPLVPVEVARIVIRESSDQQFIFLRESGGARGFPIVIGTAEACEIRRVVCDIRPERPLTHQLAYEAIQKLGADVKHVDIVDLRNNTFFARIELADAAGATTAVLDARPSDAVALALRAGCPIRVAETVLEAARTDESGPDELPEPDEDEAGESSEADEPEDEPPV